MQPVNPVAEIHATVKEKSWIEKLCGVNWRSTTSGIGTAIMAFLAWLAQLNYTLENVNGINLGAIVPVEWKSKMTLLCGIAALILGCIKAVVSKDRAVSGNKAEGYVVAKNDTVAAILPEPKPE